MKLALIQLEAHNIADHEAAFQAILARVQEACQTDADMIVLPECAYPGYLMGAAVDDSWKPKLEELLAAMSQMSATAGKYIAIGVSYADGDKLYNSAFVYDRKGVCLGRWDKSNLFHFDRQWFTAGERFPVFETEFGTVGVLVCADGRIPEVARALRLAGAKLIVDCANLISYAAKPEQLTNQQYAFMLRTRALENGCYIAVSNKVGMEENAITMAGRSFVVGPDGKIIAECSADKPELLLCEVDLNAVPALPARRPELYDLLTAPVETLPVYQQMTTPYILSDLECYTAVARFSAADKAAYLTEAANYLVTGGLFDAPLIVLPPADHGQSKAELLALAPKLSGNTVGVVCYTESGITKALFLNKDGAIGEISQTHPKGGDAITTVDLPGGTRVGAVFGEEMLIPEIPRVAMLQGADLILWFDTVGYQNHFDTMRTRAGESRTFILRATPWGEADTSSLVSADGVPLCTTLIGREHIVAGMVYAAASRLKTVFPGSDIVRHRIPSAYGILTER